MRKLMLLMAIIGFYACESGNGVEVSKINYVLDLPDKYKIDVEYYSDYYYDSKELKEFTVQDTTSNEDEEKQWVGTRYLSDDESSYYVKISVESMSSFVGGKLLRVIANDSTTIDSVFYSYGDLYLILEGEIPQNIQ